MRQSQGDRDGPDQDEGGQEAAGQGRHAADPGPAGAVVVLAGFLGRGSGAYVTMCAVTAAMAVEVLLKGNLAGKEHMAAIAAVGVLCLVSGLRHRHRPGHRPRARVGSGSGLPPIQS